MNRLFAEGDPNEEGGRWLRRQKSTLEHAVLDEDGNVIPAGFMEWAMWLGKNRQRVIEQTDLPGGIWVSTVFLGLNHQWNPEKEPLWFETMVFGPEVTDYSELFQRDWTHRPELGFCERTTTLAQAKAAHQQALEWVEAGCAQDEEDS